MREIETEAWTANNKRAQLALDMYHYRIIKYIGAYAAAMNGVDLIIFTGGIGENGPESREAISKNLTYLGVDFDKEINAGKRGKDVVITTAGSKVTVMAVTTNEELVIAQDTERIVAQQ
jgi:acetate kinase